MAAAPELVPIAERVLLRSLLIPITALCAYLFVWGCCQAVSAVARAFFGTAEGAVGWIPFVGKLVSHKIEDIEHKIVSVIGGYGHHFENQFFTRWHSLASMLRQWAAQIEETSITVFHVAHAVARLAGQLALGDTSGLRRYIHRLERYINQAIAARLARVGKIAAHAAPASVARAVGVLAGELDHVIDWDLPRLRARTKALERQLGDVWKRIRTDVRPLVGAAFVAAVAVALGKLGAGWTRCKPFSQNHRGLCALDPALVESLLAETLAILGAISIVEFAEVLQTATPPITKAIEGFISEAPKLLGDEVGSFLDVLDGLLTGG